MSSQFSACIIIPAHNEASVIGRLLKKLPSDVDGVPLQVIVVCNGCSDDSAGVARQCGAMVLEIDTPSKVAALNAGDAMASAFPRLYMDADIEISSRLVTDVVRALSVPGALCAAPPSRLRLEGRPWLVKAYLTYWRELMRMREGYVGAGLYALSREGRGRFGQFPDVIADDTFVRDLFSRDERISVQTDPSVVEAPRTLGALLRRRVRVSIGNLELESRIAGELSPSKPESRQPWWRVLLSKPSFLPYALVYAAINTITRIQAAKLLRNRRPIAWARDETTRRTS